MQESTRYVPMRPDGHSQELIKAPGGKKNASRQGEIRVQDAYSLRCCPQIHGASKDAVNYVGGRVDIEINAVRITR